MRLATLPGSKASKHQAQLRKKLQKRNAEKRKQVKAQKAKVVAHKLFTKMNSKNPETREKAKILYKKFDAAPAENKDAQAVKQMVKAEAAEELATREYEEPEELEEEYVNEETE